MTKLDVLDCAWENPVPLCYIFSFFSFFLLKGKGAKSFRTFLLHQKKKGRQQDSTPISSPLHVPCNIAGKTSDFLFNLVLYIWSSALNVVLAWTFCGFYCFLLKIGKGERKPWDMALLSCTLWSFVHPWSHLPQRHAAIWPFSSLFAWFHKIDRLSCSFRFSNIFCQVCTKSAWACEHALSCSIHKLKTKNILQRHTYFPVC